MEDIIEMRIRATRILAVHERQAYTWITHNTIFEAKLRVTKAKDKETLLEALQMVNLLPEEIDYIFGTVPPEVAK